MPNNMATNSRATGWKIPLIFCAIIIIASASTVFFREAAPKKEIKPLPQELVAKAKAIIIDLDASEAGKNWKGQIYEASGGFAARINKDEKMIALIQRAMSFKAFDVACLATTLIYDNNKRDEHFIEMAKASFEDCQNLPWAVFAANGLENENLKATLHDEIIPHWESCKSALQ